MSNTKIDGWETSSEEFEVCAWGRKLNRQIFDNLDDAVRYAHSLMKSSSTRFDPPKEIEIGHVAPDAVHTTIQTFTRTLHTRSE